MITFRRNVRIQAMMMRIASSLFILYHAHTLSLSLAYLRSSSLSVLAVVIPLKLFELGFHSICQMLSWVIFWVFFSHFLLSGSLFILTKTQLNFICFSRVSFDFFQNSFLRFCLVFHSSLFQTTWLFFFFAYFFKYHNMLMLFFFRLKWSFVSL